jgi:tRNA (guanine37-N1)-methyltransferase
MPGVLGNAASAAEDSFTDAVDGLLEAPVYTKPATWRGLNVPEVLLSGHHGNIADWRRQQSVELTRRRRPDLLEG